MITFNIIVSIDQPTTKMDAWNEYQHTFMKEVNIIMCLICILIYIRVYVQGQTKNDSVLTEWGFYAEDLISEATP